MNRPKFTITDEINLALAQIERSRGFLEAIHYSPEWLARMQKKALVKEAHHTTHIEGTHLSLEQSKKLLAGEQVLNVNPDEKRELLNYRDAFELVSAYLRDQKPVTEGLVREIHSRLVQGVRGNAARPGEYRTVQNYVINSATNEIIYTPPPAYDVPIMMKELIEWLDRETKTHPILIAGIAQFQFVHIHPFLDGNGRTARLLSTLLLYKTGYDFKRLFTISEYYDQDRPSYYAALQSVRNNEMDMTEWLEYFCLGLAFQLNELNEKSKQTLETAAFSEELGLSDYQRKALELANEGPFTLKDYEAFCPDASRRTLQRELAHLQQLKLIEAAGSTSRRVYQRII